MNKFKNLDASIKRTIIGGLIVIFVLVMIVFIVGIMNNRKLSYTKLESKLENAAREYYGDNEKNLPQSEGEETKVSSKTLVEGNYIKELSEYNDDNCSADVYVELNNGEYIYSTYLNCKNYTTDTFVSYITNNEPVVTSKDGLYKYGNDLIYRGENVNNYIEFSGILWRILRINEDNTIRIILDKAYEKENWDDRYNINKDDTVGINDFEVSRMKDYLIDFGNDDDYIAPDLKKYIVAKNVCIDKMDNLDFSNIASIQCNNYSTDKYQFSLIQLQEYFVASLDQNCNSINSESCENYNYLSSGRYWTITPFASENSKVFTTGTATKAVDAYYTYNIRPVINLSRHVLYKSGDGTKQNPYKIKLES